MAKALQTNRNDKRRADALLKTVQEQSGGLSESSIPTPEEARKSALMKKVREEGY